MKKKVVGVERWRKHTVRDGLLPRFGTTSIAKGAIHPCTGLLPSLSLLGRSDKNAIHTRELTCTLRYKRALDHSGPGTRLTKGHLIYDGVLFDDGPALDAKAVPSSCVIFDDRPAAICAYRLARHM